MRVTRVVLLLTLASLAPSAGFAQTTLGVRGGVSVASVDVDIQDVLDKSNRTGFVGGVFVDFGGSGLLGFQVGAQYSQRGADLDLGATVDQLSLDFFEIPAVVKLGIPLGIAKPSLLGGAALSFKTGCTLGGADCTDSVTSTEWSGVFGADVAFYLSSVSLWVDGRYHVAFSDISDSVDIGKLKSRHWAFQAGLGFPLGG